MAVDGVRKGVNGRRKGSVAEREVAALLEAWWRKVEPGCKFVRTPLSGGWSTSQVRSEFKTSGDIMTTAKHFPFVVEVKRREQWSVESFLAGRRSPVWGWWVQAVKQAHNENAVPLLWLRKNRLDWHVVMNKDQFTTAWGRSPFASSVVKILNNPVRYCFAEWVLEQDPMRVVDLHIVGGQ